MSFINFQIADNGTDNKNFDALRAHDLVGKSVIGTLAFILTRAYNKKWSHGRPEESNQQPDWNIILTNIKELKCISL